MEAGANLISSDWSMDGKWIVFTRTAATTGFDIYVMPADGNGKPQLVVHTSQNAMHGRLSPNGRRRLHKLAVFTGKYSLLDILVVAIMIVLVKFDGIAEVKALPGTILFCVAIVLSILAGFFVDLRYVEDAHR